MMNEIDSRSRPGLLRWILLFSVLFAVAELTAFLVKGGVGGEDVLPAVLLSWVLFFAFNCLIALPVILVSRLFSLSTRTAVLATVTISAILLTVLASDLTEPGLLGLRANAGAGAVILPAGIGIVSLLATALLLRSRRSAVRLLLLVTVLFLTALWMNWLTAPIELPDRLPGSEAADAPAKGPNLILIVIDTLRQDRLGCYGNAGGLTPHIDRFREDGILFENAIVPCPRTAQSMSTMMTGLYPLEHGVRRIFHRLDREFVTLAEILHQRGFRTLGVVSNPILRRGHSGLSQGFEEFDDAFLSPLFRNPLLVRLFEHHVTRIRLRDLHASITTDRALEMLDQVSDETPFFMWIHYFDPHWLYLPPETYRNVDPEVMADILSIYDRFNSGDLSMGDIAFEIDWSPRQVAAFRSLYDGEVRFCDREIGRLFDYLRERQLYDESVIVLTSDHGEGLGDHDYHFIHGLFLFEEEIRVPFILKPPAGLTFSNDACGVQITTTDLLPNLLSLVDSPPPDFGQSEAWFENRNGHLSMPLEENHIYGESDVPLVSEHVPPERSEGRLRMVRKGGEKLIMHPRADSPEERVTLYDLDVDPRETTDLSDERPVEAQNLLDHLRAWHKVMRTKEKAQEGPIDKSVLRDLRALGYFE